MSIERQIIRMRLGECIHDVEILKIETGKYSFNIARDIELNRVEVNPSILIKKYIHSQRLDCEFKKILLYTASNEVVSSDELMKIQQEIENEIE